MSELIYAKAFLQKGSSDTRLNVYDHLTALIRKIIVERPENAVDYIEEYSRQLKEEYYKQDVYFRDEYQPPIDIDTALKWSKLFQTSLSQEHKTRDDDELVGPSTHPNVMELLFYLEQAGVSIPSHEMFCVGISINQFREKINAEKIRYWGKIFGTQKNYHVLEVTFSEDNDEETEADENIEYDDKVEAEEEKNPDESQLDVSKPLAQEPTVSPEGIFTKIKIPPIPRAPEIKTVVVPSEKSGSGTNAKVYYVCNEPGEEWVRLPDVTPAEIIAARQIKLFFTGNLDTKIITYPTFPGDEKNYLRAQISRISASTHISPLGFYAFDEEEDYEDENERKQLVVNEEYEAISTDDLIDPSMAFWVHHHQRILNQGRTTWWNPKENLEDEDESEDESEDAGDEESPEVGPPLLTPLSEDPMLGETPPWTTVLSSKLLPEWAIAVVRSNLWPGALAYCTTNSPQKSENWYIGWGQKFSNQCFSPPPLPMIQMEYQLGPETMEMLDPTAADEEAVRIAKEMRMKKKEENEEEEEEEEELDEEEEDDDDDD